MDAFDWKIFLQDFSRELLADDEIRLQHPPDVVRGKWLGYEGASDIQIAAMEQRLGLQLPPSYRQFLQTTNGWRNTGYFIQRVWPCARVNWFRERHRDWISAYHSQYKKLPRISDEDYLVYGDEQDSAFIRTEYLEKAIEISEIGDSAIYLLNPEVVHEGEWEAWVFADWLPGASRYRSFQELMVAERQGFNS
jgi:hypothetical protein